MSHRYWHRGERPLNLATLQTIVAAWLFLASSMTGFAQAPGNEVRCSYGSRFTCNQSGCQPLEVEGAFLLVPRLDTIRPAFPGEKPPEVRRCDESGCTPVEVIPRRSGVFLNLTTLGGGYLLKFLTNDVHGTLAPMRAGDFVGRAGDFVEVATQFPLCQYR